MSLLKDIKEKELTLKETKQLMTKLLADFDLENPVNVTITFEGETAEFNLVPKRIRRRPNGMAFSIQEVPFDQLEDINDVGVYLAADTLNLSSSMPFYYGLYINFEKERDLRFFNDEFSCRNWLKKKIKLLEK